MPREHLTDAQIRSLRRGGLGPAELLGATDHLSVCSECQTRVLPNALLSSSITHLRHHFERHLTDEELIGCIDETAPVRNDFARRHLARCETCRGELRDLREFGGKTRPPAVARKNVRVWATLVAAGLVITLVLFVAWPTGRQVATVTPPGPAPAPAPEPQPLPLPYQALLAKTAAAGAIERSPVLDRLLRKEGALLSSATARSFEVISPVGIVTASDRPVFRWQTVPGASDYVVSVFDTDFHKIAESGRLTETSWQPDRPLERAGRFSWQVTARVGNTQRRFPAPPAPEAVFEVLSAESFNEVERARQMPGSTPVLIALLYAQAGALDDSRSELQAALQSNPSQQLRSLLESLQMLQETQTGKRVR